MSGATAWKPAAASAASWWRQEYQDSGKPWQRSTSGPSPCSATCMRMPLVSTVRCRTSLIAPSAGPIVYSVSHAQSARDRGRRRRPDPEGRLHKEREIFGGLLNTTKVFAHCPPIMKAAKQLGASIEKSGRLPGALVPLVYLRVALINGCPF